MKPSLRSLTPLLGLGMLCGHDGSPPRAHTPRPGGPNLSKSQKARDRKRKAKRQQTNASRRKNRK